MIHLLRRLLRILLTVLVLSAVVSAVIIYSQVSTALERGDQPSLVTDETFVEVGDLVVTVSASGTILPARQVPLVFELSAPVVEVLAVSGDAVLAGDVIARIDDTDYRAAVMEAQIALDGALLAFEAITAAPREVDVAVAQAAVNAAQAAYNAAFQGSRNSNTTQAEIARLQAELTRNQLWQTQLQRDTGLLTVPNLPPEVPPEITDLINRTVDQLNQQTLAQFTTPLNQLEFGVQIADANVEAAQSRGLDLGSLNAANAGRIQAQVALDRLTAGPTDAQMQRAQIDLEQARLNLQRVEQALAATALVAPFDGVIAQNNLTVGQLPPGNNAAVLLVDTSAYYLELPIDETDILQVQEGQAVTLFLDALPEANITGVVERVSVTPTRLGDLVTYLARVRLNPTDMPVRVGMSATARIATREERDTLLLRNNFIRIDRVTQKAFVTVERTPGRFEEVEVVLGARNETFSQVVSGLEAGQRVVRLPRNATLFGGQTR